MVTIECEAEKGQSLSVPSASILQKDGKTSVFIYNPDNHTVRSHEVTLLRLLTNGRSVIASDGLKPGELIVSSGAHHIKDGETVKPLPALTPTNVGGLL